MQIQTALASALINAGLRAPVHKKMRIGDSDLKIAFLVKPESGLLETAEPFNAERSSKRTGRRGFKQQGNIKLGESVISDYTPTAVKVFTGCGSKGDRMRIIFTMALRIDSDETELLSGDLAALALLFRAFAGKGYDFFELYDNGESGHLMQLMGENTNKASCFIEV